MFTYFLTPDENLETMRQKLVEVHKRPVYLASCYRRSNGTHFKKPGEETYGYIRALDMYLSQWVSDGCVKRETTSDPRYDNYYFDLRLSNHLRFLCPQTPDDTKDLSREDKYSRRANAFKSVGLNSGLHEVTNIWLESDDLVPEDLKPFVYEQKRSMGGTIKRKPCLTFIESQFIETPNELRSKWHVAELERVPFKPIQPPGQYSGRKIGSPETINHTLIVDCPAGPCIICHGKSGETRHLASLAYSTEAYATGHICRTCTRGVFAEWQGLLDQG